MRTAITTDHDRTGEHMSTRKWKAAVVGGLAAASLAGAGSAVAQSGTTTATSAGQQEEYVVLATDASTIGAAEAAVVAAGGQVTAVNTDVGLITVQSSDRAFAGTVRANAAVQGVAHNRPIGEVPAERRAHRDEVEKAERIAKGQAQAAPANPAAGEPLSNLQWDMKMIGATPDGSYAVNQGKKGVLVGIIDTGIDGSHPDIKPNFDRSLSRNFTVDIPDIDGPCEVRSCKDPADVDDDGHGTHVAGTVAAAINGRGIAGVAPNVTLVNLRAGQDSGFFFLGATVDALTYAGRHGIDVVNMSFYTDPWLYNCAANPADSPDAQAEQRTVIAATQRAANFARDRGVTLIAAEGNDHTDLGNPTFDDTSPDYVAGPDPLDQAYPRTVDNSCLDVPTETKGVISISALGPSGAKADYSNYGTEQTDFSAPGGYFRDFFGTDQFRVNENLVLSAYPQHLAVLNGDIDPTTGASINPAVISDCKSAKPSSCAYWQYLQGTSMASPHAVGVAALVVSAHGHRDKDHGGLTMDPSEVEKVMRQTATKTACPVPPLVDYTIVGRDPSFNALCEGDASFNGFYGHGIVNALGAVS